MDSDDIINHLNISAEFNRHDYGSVVNSLTITLWWKDMQIDSVSVSINPDLEKDSW